MVEKQCSVKVKQMLKESEVGLEVREWREGVPVTVQC